MSNTIDKIKERADIVTHISACGYKPKKIGANEYRINPAPCCGHNDCFTIYKKTQSFYCFSCKSQGSIIDFEMLRTNSGLRDTIINLEEQYLFLEHKQKASSSSKKIITPKKITPDKKENFSEIKKRFDKNSQPIKLNKAIEFFKFRNFPDDMAIKSSEHFIEHCQFNTYFRINSFLIPIIDEERKEVGMQKLTPIVKEKKLGKLVHGTIKGFFPILQKDNINKDVFIVESVANAYCLHGAGFNALCIFTTSNANMIDDIINTYPSSYNFYLWFDKGAEAISDKALLKNKRLKAIYFEEEKPDKYDVNNLLEDYQDTSKFTEQVLKYKKNAKNYFDVAECDPYEIERSQEKEALISDAKNENAKIEDTTLVEHIEKALNNNKVLHLTGSTGVGKTMSICSEILDFTAKGEKVLFATLNKTLMDSFIAKLHAKAKEKSCSVPEYKFLDTDSKEEATELENVPLIVTHFEYFQRKGDSMCLYPKCVMLLDNRYCFIDEADKLLRISEFSLAMTYIPNGDTYELCRKCKKSVSSTSIQKQKKDTPCDCLVVTRYREIINNLGIVEKKYYESFPTSNKEEFTKKEKGTLINLAFDFSKYVKTDKHRYTQEIKVKLKKKQVYYSESKKRDYNESEKEIYLNDLASHQLNPQFKNYFPFFKERADIPILLPSGITPDRLLKMDTPQNTCLCPSQVGLEVTPLFILDGVNLDGVEYSGAKGIIFTTATENPLMLHACNQVFGDKFESKCCKKIPAKFSVDLLSREKAISVDKLVQLTKLFAEETEECVLIMCKTLNEAQEVLRKARRITSSEYKQKIVGYLRHDYLMQINTYETSIDLKGKVVLTYIGANNARGADFALFSTTIINAAGFIPNNDIFIPNIELKTIDIISKLQLDYITMQLTQNIGRPLRSALEYKESEIIHDNIKKSIILHGLPKGIENFSIAPELLYESRIFRETWLQNKHGAKTIFQQINRSLERQDVLDYEKLEREKQQRKTEKKKAELERKIESLEDKVIAMAKEGYLWNLISDKLHLHRLNKRNKINLKKIYKSSINSIL